MDSAYLTLEQLEATRAEIAALPKIPSDVTIAPDVLMTLQAAFGVHDPLAVVQRIAGPELTVHVDERQAPGAW